MRNLAVLLLLLISLFVISCKVSCRANVDYIAPNIDIGRIISFSNVIDRKDLAGGAVRIEGAAGTGSGFLIKYNDVPYVITCAHVIMGATSTTSTMDLRGPLEKNKYEGTVWDRGELYKFRIIPYLADYQVDVAICSIKFIDKIIPDKLYFELADVEEFFSLYTTQEVWVIGFPMGISSPFATTGSISLSPEGFMVSAQCYFGSSGSPVINKSSHKIIGFVSGIAISARGFQGDALTHMVGCVHVLHVWGLINSMGDFPILF